MNRSRREIKTPKRFDEEPFEAPREAVASQAKQPAAPIPEAPKSSKAIFKVSLPRSQAKQPTTPVPESPKVTKNAFKASPPRAQIKQPSTPIVEGPKVSRNAVKASPPRTQPKQAPLPAAETQKVSKTVFKFNIPRTQLPQRKQRLPPRDHRTPDYEDVIPNLKLPFWDARTAAEDHEDDNVKELVHCQCSITEELGLMVQCETCLTWQHAHCLGVEKPEDAPDGYTCQACFNPKYARESMRWAYEQDWLLKGRMKQFCCDPNPQDEKHMELLNKMNRLIDDTLKIYKLTHSLRIKARLLATAGDDDPELKLFRVQWPATHMPSSCIEPIVTNHEATPADCRENLRRHIEEIEKLVGMELSRIEEQMVAIESQCPDIKSESKLSFESLKNDLLVMQSYISKISTK